ncbi:hypothetical protein [Cognatiyoonia sp.]|uniref:hypothetical protein n=1 Tax=Cognatiyoonia sp. TaxID=2211652 RepID=UPI003F69E6A6
MFKHISVMSLTASLGLMAVFLVDFVDMIFVSVLGAFVAGAPGMLIGQAASSLRGLPIS